MVKKKIKIVDNLFYHVDYSTLYQISKYFEWDRTSYNNEVVIFTDNMLGLVDNKAKIKIAWLLESYGISKNQHDWIKNNFNKFDFIFTHDKELLKIDDKFKFVAHCGCWIKPEDQKKYEKNKNISIIASSKNFLEGHILRHSCINEINQIDVYGRGYNTIDYKLDGLKDYRYSVSIENVKRDYYFTEKLIDCFRTFTIPIYWGCPSIKDFFNTDGMILIDSINDIKKFIGSNDLEKYYNERKDIISENFIKAEKYLISEDYMYENYLKDIL